MSQTITKENFPKLFLSNFLPNISLTKLKKLRIYPNKGYLWMACEHNLVNNIKGIKAMEEYDKVDKRDALEMQYDNGFMGDEYAIPLSKENDTANKISDSGLYEFYVIGKDFSWCYIVTHEPNGCGPYFIRK